MAHNKIMAQKAWENDPEFRGWLSRDSENPNKAYCNYCETSLRLKRSTLREHARTDKHIKNAQIHHLKQVGTSLGAGNVPSSELPKFREHELHQTDSDTGSSQECILTASVRQEKSESRREESSEASTLANLSPILERMGNLLIDVQSSVTVLGNEVQRGQRRVMELSERQFATDEKINEVLKSNKNILEKISKE